MKIIVLRAVLAAIALASCTPLLQDQIDRKERLWLDQSISNYQVEVVYVRSIWHAQTYLVTVDNGKVSDASASCVPAPFEDGRCEVEPFEAEDFTVPGLFAIARSQTQGEDAKYVTIHFNEPFGYPEAISFDNPNAVDDDISWAVRRFEPRS